MITRLNNLSLQKFPLSASILFKIVLGVFLTAFFLNYQPVLALPPIRPATVHAQMPEQLQVITAEARPIIFQLPHPGYISTKYSPAHPGIDIATGLSMPIKPVAKGTVTEAGFNFWGLGLMVEIEHASGYKSLYAHMGRIYVQKGQQVNESDYLGEVGLTGHTTGPHTHLELKKDSEYVDPQPLLPTIRDYPLAEDFAPVGGAKSTITGALELKEQIVNHP